tara:strand:+ start:45 stop:242 length:198 start_codon:yes stop_codon:yes gene_type:complete
MKGGKASPSDVSLIVVYSLAKALAISPLEVYKMPAQLVQDLLAVHYVAEELKAEHIEKEFNKHKK